MELLTINEYKNRDYETLGLVKGSVVRTKNVGHDFVAGLKTLVGGEISSYTAMMNEARDIATNRMIKEAEDLEADAVIGIKYSSATVMGGAAEIMAYGTAIKFK